MVIRKRHSRDASTFSLLYWNRPISLLIFSGAIVLTAQTIEIVPWIQGREKCVMHRHKFSTRSEKSDKPASGVKSA